MAQASCDENVAIIGWGVCGKATGYALGINWGLDIDYQFSKHINYDEIWKADFFILCLPTPTFDGKQDITAIEKWCEKIKKYAKEKIVIIRSTILPGTIDYLTEKYKLKLAHVPEFLTEATALEDAKHPEFLVVGARDLLIREKVKNLFNGKLNLPKNRIIMCSTTTAEMIKYAMNSFFYLKVICGNELWDLARNCGADYGKVRYALETHKWGSKNGWDVWKGGKRGVDGKCLPKDIEAFTHKFSLPLLTKMQEINKELLEIK